MSLLIPLQERDIIDSNLQATVDALNAALAAVFGGSVQCALPATFMDLVVELSQLLIARIEGRSETTRVIRAGDGEQVHIALKILTPALDQAILRTAIFAAAACSAGLSANFSTGNPIDWLRQLIALGERMEKWSVTRQIGESLDERGVPWLCLDHYPERINLLQIGLGRHQQLLDGSTTLESSFDGIRVSMSKRQSRMFLADLGFPVTRQQTVRSAEDAVGKARRIGYPVVLKTDRGAHGRGVLCDIRNDEELAQAYRELQPLAQQWKGLLIEEHVQGSDYRICLVKGRLLHVFHRIPPRVIGDGKHTVAQLVHIENDKPERGEKNDPQKRYAKLQLGDRERLTLSKQGLRPESVPERGRIALLRPTSNWSTGGTGTYVCQTIHPDNVELARRIADSLRIDIIGVDVMTTDISRSYLETDLRIIEVNHSPGIGGSINRDGSYRNEPMNAVDLLLPDMAQHFVPIVVVAGSTHALQTSLAIDRALALQGYMPGTVNESGMCIAGKPFANADALDDADPAFGVLRNREIDAAVIVRPLPKLVDYGIGAGGSDVAVLLESDTSFATRFWPRGCEPQTALEMLLRHSRKGVVMLIDDPQLAALAKTVPPRGLCAISGQGRTASIRARLAEGCLVVISELHPGQSAQVSFGRQTGMETVSLRAVTPQALLPILTGAAVLLLLGFELETVRRFVEHGAP